MTDTYANTEGLSVEETIEPLADDATQPEDTELDGDESGDDTDV